MRTLQICFTALLLTVSASFLTLFFHDQTPDYPRYAPPFLAEKQVEKLRGALPQINSILSENICLKANNVCKFEERHFPPPIGTKFLPQQAVKTAEQLRQSTLLIFVFNKPGFYQSAPLIHAMYSRLFADIRFCGPSQESSSTFHDEIATFWPLIIAQALTPFYLDYNQNRATVMDDHGETMYYCVNLAVDIVEKTRPDLKIQGIFLLHDDVMFNVWQIFLDPQRGFDLSKSYAMPWMVLFDLDTLKACSDNKQVYFGPETGPGISENSSCSNDPNPWPIYPEKYHFQVKRFYKEMAMVSSEAFRNCLANLSENTKGKNRAFGGLSDFFYLAKRDFETVLPIFKLASDNQVFQEMAVPMAFHGCMEPGSFGIINSEGWSPYFKVDGKLHRKSIFETYDARRFLFGHPMKLAGIVSRIRDGHGKTMSEREEIVRDELCLFCLLARYSNSTANSVLETVSVNNENNS